MCFGLWSLILLLTLMVSRDWTRSDSLHSYCIADTLVATGSSFIRQSAGSRQRHHTGALCLRFSTYFFMRIIRYRCKACKIPHKLPNYIQTVIYSVIFIQCMHIGYFFTNCTNFGEKSRLLWMRAENVLCIFNKFICHLFQDFDYDFWKCSLFNFQ